MIRSTALSILLSVGSASADDITRAQDANGDEVVARYQIEAEYYRSKAAALMQKYEPPTNDEVAVNRVVLDALRIRQEEEIAHIRRLQKAEPQNRQAIYVSEIFLEHIQCEIAKTERAITASGDGVIEA